MAIAALGAQSQPSTGTCKPLGPPRLLASVPEASGLSQAAGALWTHNDSGGPVLFRIDSDNRVTAVSVAGAHVIDWEDIAAGSCSGPAFANATAGEACLYIADVGDNRAARQRITIYVVEVPAGGSASTKPATSYHATYPDRPHDAEALLVIRQGAFIITKDATPRVYQFQTSLKPGSMSTLALVRPLDEDLRITGAAGSQDGRWVALRSNGALLIYRTETFLKGGDPVRVDLAAFKEPQGEGVAFGHGGELYLVSEGRGKKTAGVLTRVHCAFVQ